jgi:hypothetical protein
MSLRSRAPKIVHEKEHHGKLVLFLVAFVISILLTAYYAFDYGQVSAGFNSAKANQKGKVDEKNIRELEHQVVSLNRRLISSQRASQIDQKTVAIIQTDLKKLTEENKTLKDKVAFFEEVVTPENRKKGVHVQSFQIQSDIQARHFRYRIILTQFGNIKKGSVGEVRIIISGHDGDKLAQLSMKEISPKKINAHPYQFKYFQQIEGKIQLPVDFRPDYVEIVVDPKGSWPKAKKSKYSWLVAENRQNISK